MKRTKPKLPTQPQNSSSANIRVLEIGAGPKPQAQVILPHAKIETMDVDKTYNPTYLHDAATMPEELHGVFDVVFASHVLEHFPWYQSLDVLREWRKALKVGGHLHVFVPSLEWAAEQILSEKPSKAIYGHLYAGSISQWDVHKAGFTLRGLRALFEHTPLSVVMAGSGPYPIRILGEIMRAEQHYVIGVRGSE